MSNNTIVILILVFIFLFSVTIIHSILFFTNKKIDFEIKHSIRLLIKYLAEVPIIKIAILLLILTLAYGYGEQSIHNRIDNYYYARGLIDVDFNDGYDMNSNDNYISVLGTLKSVDLEMVEVYDLSGKRIRLCAANLNDELFEYGDLPIENQITYFNVDCVTSIFDFYVQDSFISIIRFRKDEIVDLSGEYTFVTYFSSDDAYEYIVVFDYESNLNDINIIYEDTRYRIR